MSDFTKPASVDLAEGRDPFEGHDLTDRETHIVAMISRSLTTVLVDGLRCSKICHPEIREPRVAEAIAKLLSLSVEKGNADFLATSN